MSRVFDEIAQIAYVSRNMDDTLAFMTEKAGIGPWFLAKDLSIPECRFRGKPIDINLDVALANSGGTQIEIIVQTSPEPSVYTEFLDLHGDELAPQHLSSWTNRFDEVIADAKSRGFTYVQEGKSRYGSFVYFEHPDKRDFVFEVTELTPERRSTYEQIREAARDWDGSDPVRLGWPAAKI